MKAKVRVRTADLLAAVKAKQAANEKAAARAAREYPGKMSAYRSAVVDEAIVISADDYARYLG